MNIAIITPQYTIGGAEKYILKKAKWLNENGHKCIVICEKAPQESILKENGIGYYLIDDLNMNPYFVKEEKKRKILEDILKILEEEKIELLEATHFQQGYMCYLINKYNKIPFLMNVLIEVGFENSNRYRLLQILDKYGLYYNLGQGSNKYIEDKCKIKLLNCRNIPIPIELDTQLKIKKKNYILTICRMASEKMYVKSLIKDFSKLCQDRMIDENIELYIIGDGEKFQEVKKIADEENKKINYRIKLLGYILGPELEEYYANCLIYIGMGTTLLTAAGYGKPTLVSSFDEKNKCYGFFKVENNFSFGQYLDGMVKDSYYNYIKKLLDDKNLQKKYAVEGKKYIYEEFLIEKIMEKWVIEYTHIIKNNIIINENLILKLSINEKLRFEIKKILIKLKIFNFVNLMIKRVKL